MRKGKIIVLEGLDGCGKSTQLDLAFGYLKENKVNCRKVSFPNYDSVSGKLVKQYLDGIVPCEGRDGAYAASVMYAVDRYVSYASEWGNFFHSGGVVLAGRYTTSNAIYQLTKLPPEEQEYYLNWLCDLEYGKLNLPEPDLVIYLDMPIEVSQQLLDNRYAIEGGQKDIHERNTEFLAECRKSALYAAQRFGWKVIECSDGKYPLPIEDVYDKVCECLRVLLNYA